MNHRTTMYILGFATAFTLLITGVGTAHALTLLGINIQCDPALAPSSGGCGLTAFFSFILELIDRFMIYVAMPIAALMIIFAGYVMITSGGSPAKYEKGLSIIKAAAVGLVIALSSKVIVDIIQQLFNQ